MSFAAPWLALGVAGVVLPSLLLLYFLKLRRRELRVPSTMFWMSAIHDLQANTPFQRLRLTPLFLLQLLLLLLLVLALSQPNFGERSGSASGQRIILLMDVSASMNAKDAQELTSINRGAAGKVTRLERSKQLAHELVNRAGARASGEPAQFMVIAFGNRARIVQPLTSDRSAVQAAIDSLEGTDCVGRLTPAIALADAFVKQQHQQPKAIQQGGSGGEGGAESAAQKSGDARVVLISDGRFDDDNPPTLADGGALEYLPVVPPIRSGGTNAGRAASGRESGTIVGDSATGNAYVNLGIVLLSARRDYRNPVNVDLLCGLESTDVQPRTLAVRMNLDGLLYKSQTVTIPGVDATTDQPGSALASFRFPNTIGGVVTISITTGDALAADDTAGLTLLPVQRHKILVVYPDGAKEPERFLMKLVDELPFQDVLTIHQSAFDANYAAGIHPVEKDREGQVDKPESTGRPENSSDETVQEPQQNQQHVHIDDRNIQLVVFDRVRSPALTDVPSISFGAAPEGSGVRLIELNPSEKDVGRQFISWDRHNPLMTSVNLDEIVIADRHRLVLPRSGGGVKALAYADDGVAIASVEEPVSGRRHVICSFDLEQTNWPLHLSFAIFMQNAVDYLTLAGEDQAGIALRTGQTRTFRIATGSTRLTITDSEGRMIENAQPRDADDSVTAGPIDKVGLYGVTGAGDPAVSVLPVNLVSDVESDIRPMATVDVNKKSVASASLDEVAPNSIWKWFAAAALLLLLLEWMYYTRRAGIR